MYIMYDIYIYKIIVSTKYIYQNYNTSTSNARSGKTPAS